jgi:hypothetical protein
MNMGFKHIVVSLALIGCAGSSVAQMFSHREAAQAFYTQRAAADNDRRENEHSRPALENGRGADSSGSGQNGDNSSQSSTDASKRQGKMSPEERRALRRQIDEAGHDIYKAKRK